MSGDFEVADYVVLALVLVGSSLIGVYYAWASRHKGNSKDFLTGGRSMTALPVSMSLTASFMSSNTLLANPAEVYRYGAIFGLLFFGYVLTIVITSEIFLPVFYRLALTSTYEYLELRFNRVTRLLGTVLFMIQTILYTGIIIYGPALALSQVTDVDLWGGIFSTGAVCILYCTLGGLKAVVWTDVFQIAIMLAGYLSVTIMCVNLQGGFANIISDSQQGGRINMWDFDMNPQRRHTFWTLTIGGTCGWVAVFGINQAPVQRYVSCKSIAHARAALYINLVGLSCFLMCSVFAGMCLYSVYKNCDPWTAGLISTTDQLMPYLVVDTLTGSPGLSGLFVAAVLSGSLRFLHHIKLSSSINALAAVTIEDLIKPYTNLSEKQLTWLSRAMTISYGVLCIAMAGLSSVMGGIMQATVTISGILAGPLLGLFTMGIICPFANTKGGLTGVVSGLIVSVSVCVVSLISPPPPEMTRPLPLTTDGCNFTTTGSLNWTSPTAPTEPSTITTTAPVQITDGIHLHSVSYLYFCLIGTVTAIIVGLIASLFTGGWKERVDSRLMLMKEDTILYHTFTFCRDRVMRRTGKLDLIMNGNEKSGDTNPAFSDTEMY
ncbi:sodium-coupled monocarboxylate transporter 1 [Solea senegalensis]|uniref:Sodium-coupled monocarboxylate transporter 1 n=1 Tax=Solea senegalensis TaxID=28829 RepID=A0AAV6QVM6_SOLSE|nr:sodium-coupled monocarboxylate transporter 1 [Solea senegalensis]